MKQIDREILSFAIPSIVTNITTPLLGLMDVAIVGHMGDAVYIAAISIGGTIFNMIYWLFGFLRMGTSGLSAQAHGSGDRMDENLVLARGLSVALIASLLLIIFSPLIGRISVELMDISGPTAEMALRYFRILIWGAPAVLMTFTFSGWFLGLRNPRAPMWVSLVINISNIILSLTLVYGFRLKIEGVASGTLVAQWLGALACLYIAVRHHSPQLPPLGKILRVGELKRYFIVNTDIFLRTLCMIAVTVWFTRAGAEQGTLTLAANTLLMQFFMFFSYFMDGFAFAGESISGNRKGASDLAGLSTAVRALLKWGLYCSLLFTIIYVAGGKEIIGLLSDDVTVNRTAREFSIWVITIPAAGFLAFTWDGIFIGMTSTRLMLVSIVVATVVYFVSYHILFPIIGNHGLWIAFLLYLLVRGLLLTVLYRKTKF